MVKLKVNTLTPAIQQINRQLRNLPKEAYKEFVDKTPKKTGYAKRNTKLRGKTIVADYNYAGVLDKGRHMTNRGMRGSTQAPEGMTKPTIEFIKEKVRNIFMRK